MKRLFCLTSALLCAACTPGSFALATSGGAVTTGRVTTIDVDLTKDPGATTPAGGGSGYAPVLTLVAVGDGVRFKNSDGFAHTATSIAGATFPSAYPFTGAALTSKGSTLSGGFSSGSLPAGTSSQTLIADKPGLYLFGCFYHYGAPMRAAIEVQ
jgi:plastocyanin